MLRIQISNDMFKYIVHTDRGSLLSGMAGPIYTITNKIGGKYAEFILEDTCGQGSGKYKFGFVTGSILLATGIGPVASLLAVVRSMMD